MSGHTKGPWHMVRHMGFTGTDEESDHDCLLGFANSLGERVCWFGNSEQYYPTGGDEPSQADAALIAASPELLECLKEARKHLDNADIDLAYIDEVIAKAEGRV